MAKKWARVLQSGAHGLRRGAWYAIVNDSSPSIVILDVSKKNVPVDRKALQVADAKPMLWSVVTWPEGRAVPHRMTEKNLPRTYGVCPGCRARSVELAEGVQTLKCTSCGVEAGVDWKNAC